ncbi:MAG: alcohol dehydrogenase catalytic domain-containing protein [Cyanobacteria bacterium HKST-UBA06]|nr:alcohol dehydrogenase catalytic domain-containing protein [Cyanobacteria bacterium HKST-UBA05]MCA9807642.1 alcohol dehydrogenase catalytic domain-containing protein [Cyanobacteria bacterium HKST-UBA06]MCA9841442.1 alcohol dehydrogenase catalytic domain-containing protein [Cyanobacteria bacterium HKST-UBA03]
MKVAVVNRNREVMLEEAPKPTIPQGGALIRVKGCGVCGSDVEKWQDRPIRKALVLGHEVVGVVEELSSEALHLYPSLHEGQRVAVAHHASCMACYYCQHESPTMCEQFKTSNLDPGGFSQWLAVSAAHLAHTVHPIVDHVSDEAASCVEPLACCLRAVDRLPRHASSALVVGLGFIGQLTAQIMSRRGIGVVGTDLQPDRIELARDHRWILDGHADADQAETAVKAITEGRGADVVFLTVVNAATLKLALAAVRDGGTLLVFSASKSAKALIDPNPFYFRELSLITSYSPSMAHLRQAASWINQGLVDVTPLMTHRYDLSLIEEGLECYKSGKAIKVYITL